MPAAAAPNEAEVPPELLQLGARIDVSYLAGDPIQQGFFIPSVRLTASGSVASWIDYRLSLGQAREFSSVLLPEIVPVEAYLNLNSGPEPGGLSPRFNWRIGMFTPWFNPWWTPDLSDLPIPDYNEIHKEAFLSRDIGTQLSFQVIPDRLEVAAGAFDGTGILGMNTNNARAFSAFVRGISPLGRSRLQLGSGAYSFAQSSPGTVNYKSDWVHDVFLQLDLGYWDATLSVDGFYGQFQNSAGSARPLGFSGTLIVGIIDGLKLFTRGETLRNPPSVSGAIRHVQVGPLLDLNRALKIFTLFDYLQLVDGSVQSSAMVRLRLVI
jgi:hypothetical protein